LKPNDVWIGDGHSFKAKVAHPVHGRPFKPEVTVILDGCTRCVMGFSVSLAESCVAVADALRIGMTHFGVPLIYYSDNGSGQTGKTIDHEITGLAARLGICHETGIAGNPQGRGIIERWWQDNLIRLARGYETFTGSGMDSSTKNLTYRKLESAFNALEKGKELSEEQQRYLKKLPSWKQFMADVARCVDEYNHRPHGELPKKADGSRFAPLEYREWRLRSDGLTPDFLAKEELDMLFRPQEIRTVQRGWLDLFGNSYFSADLGAYNGDKVRVAYDWSDARSVLVYDMAGKLLAKALLDGNKHEAFPTTRLEQLAEQRRKGRVKRAQQVVKLANAEANPALEMAQDYDALMGFSGGLEQVLQPVQKAAEETQRLALKTGTDDEWDGDIY
ncbi:transposase InsO family protein, partial [Neisseria perflava]|uniref:transposase family protein n=1 Tax=Neisseria perflava TaxID=33053 RepID=UPI00209F1615